MSVTSGLAEGQNRQTAAIVSYFKLRRVWIAMVAGQHKADGGGEDRYPLRLGPEVRKGRAVVYGWVW